jgi:LSD1 subclass zinc finger protein
VYGHLNCGGCSITLLYPLGAQSVKCSVCHHVSPVPLHDPWQGGGSGGPHRQQRRAPAHPVHTVVVENPPSLDADGNEVANIAVGVKEEDLRRAAKAGA